MSSSDLTGVDDLTGSLPISVYVSFLFLFSVLMICYVLLLPIFEYTRKANEEQDKKDKLYPTVKHFFWMVRTSYYFFIALIVVLFLQYPPLRNIIFYSLFIIDQTFELLLFSIALEKCLCTFFPKLEPYFTSARNSLLDKIWALYIVHVIKELSILVVVRRTVGNGKAKDTVGYVHGIILSCMALFSMLSALMHFPIMKKMRKLAYLDSTQLNTLYTYIFWLTITVVVFKLIYILLFTIIFILFLPQFSIQLLVYIIAIIGGLTTPIIIESVYIVCNIDKIYNINGRKIREFLKLYLK
ncbi:Serpentine Receptor, class Z [Caenorhabditis elegans]|uniref:Serpentine Receptor, class Z n=1 Tax=Caenorhabditis elegans TaxID=6239 RepID=Q688B9_CAEEL|nr:Serpentine Receptor, class Z [Caenorhabditis elegans]CCD64023.1 Serpentine Receptor, class Z [Caenorhabditis elegans]|eukprot:NP_500355.2 Serpentine Receptor, class Z [Caenorhabditis elegans]